MAPAVGLASGLYGIRLGARKELERARTEEEREAIRRYRRFLTFAICFTCPAMFAFSYLQWWKPFIGLGYAWMFAVISSVLYLKRATRAREAAEKREDLAAWKRRQRFAWVGYLGFALGVAVMAWATWRTLFAR